MATLTDNVQITMFPESHYIGKRIRTSFQNMRDGKLFQNAYAQIGHYCENNKMTVNGAPATLYFEWDEDNERAEFAPALRVAEMTSIDHPDLEHIHVPEGRSVVLTYIGDYAALDEPHAAIAEYMVREDLPMGDLVIEEYLNDPETEPDSANWQTNIYYLLESES